MGFILKPPDINETLPQNNKNQPRKVHLRPNPSNQYLITYPGEAPKYRC